jgi:hypothetical protein
MTAQVLAGELPTQGSEHGVPTEPEAPQIRTSETESSDSGVATAALALWESGLLVDLRPYEIFQLMLDHLPSTSEDMQLSTDPLELVMQILRSNEWQAKLPAWTKRHFTTGRWLYFVHIPKTAGTALRLMFVDAIGGDYSYRIPAREEYVSFSIQQRFLAGVTRDPGHIRFVTGHTNIREMRPMDVATAFDTVTAVIRDPLDQLISYANFYLGMQATKPEHAANFWAAALSGPPRHLSVSEAAEALPYLARLPSLQIRNYLSSAAATCAEECSIQRARLSTYADVSSHCEFLGEQLGLNVLPLSRSNMSIYHLSHEALAPNLIVRTLDALGPNYSDFSHLSALMRLSLTK